MAVQKLEWQAFDRLAGPQAGPEVGHKTDQASARRLPRLVNTERASAREREGVGGGEGGLRKIVLGYARGVSECCIIHLVLWMLSEVLAWFNK